MKLEPKSRTQQKKDALLLQKLGERLVKLSSQQLGEIGLPTEIVTAIKFLKTQKKHGAYRRQMQYIGALMREIDPEPIQKALELIELGNYKKSREFKKIEAWRDELIAGNDSLFEEIITKYPAAERQRLAQLVRNARKEKLKNKPQKSSRSLFRYLKEIIKGGVDMNPS